MECAASAAVLFEMRPAKSFEALVAVLLQHPSLLLPLQLTTVGMDGVLDQMNRASVLHAVMA